jgi:ABC-type glycerol-3-phosphate transport system substrate-binding protein
MNVSRRQWLLASLGTVACAASGCGDDPIPDENGSVNVDPSREKPLRVLVVDAPELATRIDRYWKAQTDSPFELRQATVAEVLQKPRFAADVVIYPAELLGMWAAAERLSPLSEETLKSDAFEEHGLLTHSRTTEVQWGPEIFAVSLGSPTLQLYWRSDLFAAQDLAPPQTWAEYQQVLCALAKSPEKLMVPALEPLATGWAGQTLLARAASYVRHRNEYAAIFNMQTMQPQWTRPPFVRALEELVAAAQTVDQVDTWLETTPQTARAAIYAGQCALAWSWPSPGFEPNPPPQSAVVENLRLAALPGSPDVFVLSFDTWEKRAADATQRVPLIGGAGSLASVTREARRPSAAEYFVAWLSSGEPAADIATAAETAAPFRTSHWQNPQRWVEKALPAPAVNDLISIAKETQASGLVLLPLRIPGASEYHAALDEAVRAAVRGEESSSAALTKLSQRFEEITESRGRAQQRRAYLHSLGLEG